jgi:hypothetical protein
MTTIKDLIESLPFHPYASIKPFGMEQAEQLLLRAILNDSDHDTGSLSLKDFHNTVYGLIFDVWLNLKKHELPRGIKEVAAQLRQLDLIGKNGLEMVGEAFLIFLQEFYRPKDVLDTMIQNSIVRKLQTQVSEENINQNLGEVLEGLSRAVKEIP